MYFIGGKLCVTTLHVFPITTIIIFIIIIIIIIYYHYYYYYQLYALQCL